MAGRIAYYGGIVTDGLILDLDAAKRDSYPGSGTVWRDIVSNTVTGSLINGPMFNSDNGGSIVFDGTNDYADLGATTPTSLQGNPSFTVDGWFKSSGDWTGGATWGIGGGDGFAGGGGINSYSWTTLASEICIDLWGATTIGTGQTYSTTTWKHIVWVKRSGSFDTTNISIWINNTEYTAGGLNYKRNSGATPVINNNGLVLGRAGLPTNNYYGKPIIANYKIYNKALSSTEVTQNYNALKGRFGL
jgi:hypothetical protein